MNEKLKGSVQLNAGTFAFGVTAGTLTTAQQTHLWRTGGLAAQVGSAVGAAAPFVLTADAEKGIYQRLKKL